MTWKNYYHPDDDSQAMKNYINGTLSCFCDDEYTRIGFWSAFHEYRSDGNDQLMRQANYSASEEPEDEVEQNQICKTYVWSEKFNRISRILTSLLIVMFNALFYIMTYPAISTIGMHKISNETVLVTLTIFICLCLDMIFLPVLISMNFMYM